MIVLRQNKTEDYLCDSFQLYRSRGCLTTDSETTIIVGNVAVQSEVVGENRQRNCRSGE